MPGNNPGMLVSSDILGSDAIIIDLEDAVAINEKDAARILVDEYLSTFKNKRDIFVRINPLETEFYENDIEMLKKHKIKGIMLPKADVKSVKQTDKIISEAGLDFKIFCLIETAEGIENSYNILSACDKVEGVLLGAEDLTLDLGAVRTKASDEIKYARMKIVSVAKALSLQAVDTPWTDTDDLEGLREDAQKAKAMGMTGKALISPRHVDIVNEVFSPSKSDIEYALRVMQALSEAKEKGLGAFSLNGKMVDKPIIMRAVNTLKMSSMYKEEYDELI